MTNLQIATIESTTNRLFTYYCDNAQNAKALQINRDALEIFRQTIGVPGFLHVQLLAAIAANDVLTEIMPNINVTGVITEHEHRLKDIIVESAKALGVSFSEATKSFVDLGSDHARVIELAKESLLAPENVEGFVMERIAANKTIDAEDVIQALGDIGQGAAKVVEAVTKVVTAGTYGQISDNGENNESKKVLEMVECRDGRVVLTDGKDVFLYSAYDENGDPMPDAKIDLETPSTEITYADLLEFRNETELADTKIAAEETITELSDVVADTLVNIANQEVSEELVSREAEVKVEIGVPIEVQEQAFNLATNKLENYTIAKGKKAALKVYLESQDLGYVLEDIEAGEPLEFEKEIIEALKEFLTLEQPK
ncbi:hypothetical protein MA9V2_193 [Chryseobacterium phage MA9V-2]|nr:hypothetical protein MA9V2_193 [Chryseobacterium phage MA9V-2]